MDSEKLTSFKERKRDLVCDDLRRAAINYLAEHGYDSTTVDDLAAATGVSRRTFFRYFPTKDDVVVEAIDALADKIAEHLAWQPRDVGPLEAVRTALCEATQRMDEDDGRSRAVLQMIESHPSLRGRFLDREVEGRRRMADSLHGRLPDPLQATMVAGIAIAVLHASLDLWSQNEHARLRDCIDSTVDALEAALGGLGLATISGVAGQGSAQPHS